MSRLKNKKIIRHPNFFQKHHKLIGLYLIFFGICELLVSAFLIFFIPDPFVSPLPEIFLGKRPVIDDSSQLILQTALNKEKIAYKKIQLTREGNYLISLSPEGEVLLPKDQNITLHIASLQQLLARITMEDKQISRVDFRFEKPVIVLKK